MGIRVNVVDSTTSLPVSVGDLKVTATDGGYVETVEIDPRFPNAPIFIVEDRAGTYTVKITGTGYAPWQDRVRVRMANRCHVQQTVLVARMQRLGTT
jgi:hypothetical protein